MGLLNKVFDNLPGVGSAISGVGSLVGGAMSAVNASKNRDQQREFAQNSLSWRVQEARKNGIHSAYALGFNGNSFIPVTQDNDYGLQGFGQSLQGASRTNDKIDDDSVLFQKESNRLALQGQMLENEMKALEIESKWKQLKGMGQSPAFKGLNPYAVPDSTSVPVGNGQSVGDSQVRLGYGFDSPIQGYSFVPLPDGSLRSMPSEKRVDYITEGAPFGLGAIPFYLERYYHSNIIKSHLARKYGVPIYDDNALPFMGSYSFKRPPWYRRPIYQKGKWFWQD